MKVYQKTYLENCLKVQKLLYTPLAPASDGVFAAQVCHTEQEIRSLRAENLCLLTDHLFPQLDALAGAGETEISELSGFADALMDWKRNADIGVYCAIHAALLRLHRIRADRDGIIRELYKLGMGMYYMNRSIERVPGEVRDSLYFQAEMLFTEAASYLPFLHRLTSEETRGYVIRAQANIAIASRNPHRKIAASARVLSIAKDPDYTSASPGLPWERYIRATHQQMSANRTELSRGDLTPAELSLVLDSCYEVFRPELGSGRPSNRWLWPYYEMNYTCGHASLEDTLHRMEQLILATDPEDASMDGLYGNVQLPIYYGRLVRDTQAREDGRRLRFLDRAYRRMLRRMLSLPEERMDDYVFFLLSEMLTEFVEIPGQLTYAELVRRLMARYDMPLFLACERRACVCDLLAGYVVASGNSLADAELPENFVHLAAFYMDAGRLKMHLTGAYARQLFSDEDRMMETHDLAGFQDLRKHESTAMYADTALGHHAWYAQIHPVYDRNTSPYRKVTDIDAVAAYLMEEVGEAMDEKEKRERLDRAMDTVLRLSGTRFSPVVAACLGDREVRAGIGSVLFEEDAPYLALREALRDREES
ncbi:MAG: hypothetical protein IJ708_08580 [Clostridia bacterium]|nr:hypothetical protein [Clostridia bacterium]